MDILKKIKEKGYALFFNQGDKYTEEFMAQEKNRPNFFWYHDSFYSHLSIDKQDRYLHIFIKKKDDYNFSFMQGNKTWEDVYNHYQENKEKSNNEVDIKRYILHNPPILRSSDILIPDLIFDFEKEGNIEAVCVFPNKYKGLRCKFFGEKHFPIDFMEIPELMKVINNIVEYIYGHLENN